MAEEKFEFRLNGVELAEFSMTPLTPGEKLSGIFKFDVTVETRLSPERSLLVAFVSVNIRDNDKEKSLAFIRVAVGFDINKFDEVITKNEKGDYVIPIKLDAATRRIAISTTRGVMFGYFKGTHLHKAFLPIIPELMTPEKKKIKP